MYTNFEKPVWIQMKWDSHLCSCFFPFQTQGQLTVAPKRQHCQWAKQCCGTSEYNWTLNKCFSFTTPGNIGDGIGWHTQPYNMLQLRPMMADRCSYRPHRCINALFWREGGDATSAATKEREKKTDRARNGAPLWHRISLKTCTHKNQARACDTSTQKKD